MRNNIGLWLMLLFGISVHAQMEGWQWVNPLPQGNMLNSVYFTDSLTGWAAGYFGTILKTTDGGAHWEFQNGQTTQTLRELYFLNPYEGWIVGDNGTVLHTANGGDDWMQVHLPTGMHLADLIFTSPDTGWIVGDSGILFKTSNGGATWQKIPLGVAWDFSGIDFVNPTEGWILIRDGGLYHTTDGGINWSLTFPSVSWSGARDIRFSDTNHGWIVTQTGQVIFTTDGGTTWTVKTAGTSGYRVFPLNNDTLFITASGAIMKSHDGGNSWNIVFNLIDFNIYTGGGLSGFFLSGKYGWAAGGNGIIVKSTSRGNSWNFISSSILPVYNASINDIFFLNDSAGWITVPGYVLKTGNGGNTWQTIPVNMPPNTSAPVIYFIDADTGWLAVKNIVFKTMDGGMSWSADTLPLAANFVISGIIFIDANTGWCTSGNYVLKTTNGGHTWSVVHQDSSNHNFRSIYFYDALTGFVAGSGGLILLTRDGGTTWNSIPSGTQALLNKIIMRNNRGIIAGSNNTVLISSDSGMTWALRNPATSSFYHVYDAGFVNDTTVLIAGAGGSIYRSDDGGDTWMQEISNTTNLLTGLEVVSPSLAFAAGQYGTILARRSAGCPPISLMFSPVVPPSCHGGNDGQISTAINGGTAPYSYMWSNGATTSSLNGLAAGVYHLTVTDARGCFVVDSVEILDPPALSISLNIDDVTCNGGVDGAITPSPAGGTPPYSYTWSNGATTPSLNGLAAGVYHLTLTDANGCTVDITANVDEPDPLEVTGIVIDSVNPGSIIIDVRGGIHPYSFLWSNGATTQNLTGITSQGIYTVVITDSASCTDTASFTVGGIVHAGYQQTRVPATVFPSPNQGIFKIYASGRLAAIEQLTMTDIRGNLVFAKRVQPTNAPVLTVDCANLPPGVYFLILRSEDSSKPIKVILQ